MKRFLFIPSCEEVREGLTDFMECAQPWHRRLGYRFHFLFCVACKGLLKTFQLLPDRLRKVLAPTEPAPPAANEVLDRVLQKLKKNG